MTFLSTEASEKNNVAKPATVNVLHYKSKFFEGEFSEKDHHCNSRLSQSSRLSCFLNDQWEDITRPIVLLKIKYQGRSLWKDHLTSHLQSKKTAKNLQKGPTMLPLRKSETRLVHKHRRYAVREIFSSLFYYLSQMKISSTFQLHVNIFNVIPATLEVV